MIAAAEYQAAAGAGDYLRQRELASSSPRSALYCRRRSVSAGEKVPFDERLRFAEDQGWAKSALAAGHSLAYAANSRVYHSHNYSLAAWYRLKSSSFRAFYLIFGRPLLQTALIGPALIADTTGRLKASAPAACRRRSVIS